MKDTAELSPVITYARDAIVGPAHVAAALNVSEEIVGKMDLPSFQAGRQTSLETSRRYALRAGRGEGHGRDLPRRPRGLRDSLGEDAPALVQPRARRPRWRSSAARSSGRTRCGSRGGGRAAEGEGEAHAPPLSPEQMRNFFPARDGRGRRDRVGHGDDRHGRGASIGAGGRQADRVHIAARSARAGCATCRSSGARRARDAPPHVRGQAARADRGRSRLRSATHVCQLAGAAGVPGPAGSSTSATAPATSPGSTSSTR
jgi:hypothetical protein